MKETDVGIRTDLKPNQHPDPSRSGTVATITQPSNLCDAIALNLVDFNLQYSMWYQEECKNGLSSTPTVEFWNQIIYSQELH